MTSLPTDLDKPRIYSGDDANTRVRELADRRRNGALGAGEAVDTGVGYFDDNNPPLMRGEVAILEGLTSHGKSLWASTIAAHTLARLGNSGNRGLLIAMTEETVEARRVQMWGDARVSIRTVLTGRASLEIIDENISKTQGQPVYFIGQTTELDQVGTANGIIRPSTIADAIYQLLARGVEPELVIIDHVHDLEPDRSYRSRDERYDAVARELVQLANALGRYCPMLALAQCVKEVEKRQPLDGQPNAYDLLFMQELAARARDIYSIYYPTRNRGAGLKYPTARGDVKAAKGLFLVQACKARNGRCGGDTLAMTAFDDQGDWSNRLQETHGGF